MGVGSVGGGSVDQQPNSVSASSAAAPEDVKPPGSVGASAAGTPQGAGQPNSGGNIPGNSDATADLFDSFDSKDGGNTE